MPFLLSNWRSVLWLLLAVCVAVFGSIAQHYRNAYEKADNERQKATQLANSRQQTITRMQADQKSVAAIDEKYTRELADAKQTIADLQRDVAAGTKRLRVNATCQRVSTTTAPAILDDASSPQLTPDAERAYWHLREQLATADKQIGGLQDYIRSIQK
nr:lysis protein [Pantoea sp. 201603H]